MEGKIYTRQGDGGDTSLFTGGKVSKINPRIQAYGAVDELNSALGVARAFATHPDIKKLIFHIQNKVMNVASLLATKEPPMPHPDQALPQIYERDIEGLEKTIDHFSAQLRALTSFIVPGSNKSGALLDVARTTCRRAERALVALMYQESIDPTLLKFLNRLSDLLFVMERIEYQYENAQEKLWTK
ncbi:MAG: cob(I)yrinic acid a,c-diamide adenosyltransferase [Patescibacteria group bacterium]|nr:cob(I)yrinic acid a,c-diamide adenosyltransferase [Patescibacteria group bacterium]